VGLFFKQDKRPDIVEQVDSFGRLIVPIKRLLGAVPEREGWRPTFVNVNLNRDPVKLAYYEKEEQA
jgi:hypothetical protein